MDEYDKLNLRSVVGDWTDDLETWFEGEKVSEEGQKKLVDLLFNMFSSVRRSVE